MDKFCGGRGFWGPTGKSEEESVSPHWDVGFDFSTCFEDTVLTTLPVLYLFFFGFLMYFVRKNEMSYLSRSTSGLYLWKQGLTYILVLHSLADAVRAIWFGKADFQIFSPSVLCLGYVVALFALSYEHTKGLRASSFMALFWFLTFVVDIVRMRTLILMHDHGVYHEYTVFMFGGRFLVVTLVFILSLVKEPPLRRSEPNACPENSASFFSVITFWWMNPLIVLGFKRSLTENDLWALNHEDQAHQLSTRLRDAWRTQLTRSYPSFVKALASAFGFLFYSAGFFKLGQDLLGFVGPILLQYVIDFVNDDSAPAWHGYGLIILMFSAGVLQTVLLHQYFHRVMKTGMRLRSAVVTAVYNKSLVLSNAARQTTTTGEISNLMAVDAQRFMDLTPYLHMVWSAPLQIALSMYFLWAQLGPSVLAGLGVMILLIPVNALIAKKSRALQVKQMGHKDKRIKLMNELLTGIKVLKLYAWENPYKNFVTEIREKEVGVLKSSSYLTAISMFTWTCAPFLVSFASFVTYTLAGNELSASTAFVSLSLFNILRFPLTMLPFVVSTLVEAQVSVGRLRKFLLLEEMDLSNVTRNHGAGNDPVAVKLTDASFAWNHEAGVVLKNISFTAPRSSLVAIVGQVGAGKSSLVNGILGEMIKVKGHVLINGSVAYVPQQAWIQNGTLRDNILFGRDFDYSLYNKVIQSCALEPDLAILPGGDMTEIGEKGINLSGGQKQRVSLARAVYQNADIVILDDPLSAVDAHVGKHIFEQVLGPKGLLAKKTRVWVTNAVTFLPNADHVVVLKGGAVSEIGTYDNLIKAQGEFAKFIDEYLAKPSQEEESTDDDNDREKKQKKESLKEIDLKEEGKIKDAAKEKKDVTEKTKLIEKETAAEGSVKLEVYKTYFKSVGYWISFWVAFSLFVTYAFQVASSLWLSDWSNETDKNPAKAQKDNSMYLGVYAGLGLANAVGIFIASLLMAYGCVRSSQYLHDEVLRSVLRAPMSFFDTTPVGRILNRFSKDIYVIDDTVPRSLRSFMATFMQVICIVVVISITTPYILLAIAPICIMYYFVQLYYVASSRQLQRLEGVARSPIYAHFSETLTGVSSIRAYEQQSRFILQNEEKVNFNLQAYYPSVSANRWLATRLETLGNLVILFAGIFAVVEHGHINAGMVGLSLSYAMSVTQTLNWMVRMSSQMESDIVAVERLDEYIKLTHEAAEHGPFVLDPKWPPRGEITFDNFQVRYRAGLDLVLKGINVNIQSTEKIGVVGRTGAGKSSLTLSLFRLIEAAAGKITIDGQDISTLGLEDLRSRLTIIPQDPVLFSGTVRDNLDPFRRYADEEIWRALEVSHLKSYVKGLEGGLEAKVAEAGENFSVGQRQLICLSRALLRKTKVLILDEATAAIDLETDDLIQLTIRKEFRDCTIITIAHRLNTIMDSDKIMVLDQGQIVEFASPSSLLSNPSSVFFKMAKAANLLEKDKTSSSA